MGFTIGTRYRIKKDVGSTINPGWAHIEHYQKAIFEITQISDYQGKITIYLTCSICNDDATCSDGRMSHYYDPIPSLIIKESIYKC